MTASYQWAEPVQPADFHDPANAFGVPPDQSQPVNVLVSELDCGAVWVYVGHDGQRYYEYLDDNGAWIVAPAPDDWRAALPVLAAMLDL